MKDLKFPTKSAIFNFLISNDSDSYFSWNANELND